jgi:hypothetical protein
MFRTAILAVMALLALSLNAEARQRHKTFLADPSCNVIMPCEGVAPSSRGEMIARKLGFGAAQKVYTPRAATKRPTNITQNIPSQSLGYTIARPARYIAGRLICAINVNAALAERGIRGTGSALAHSFDHWGIRAPVPIPGAVAVTDRRGGGHVAIVSRVDGSRVFVWNPSPRGRGWREVEYTSRHARYRVPS